MTLLPFQNHQPILSFSSPLASASSSSSITTSTIPATEALSTLLGSISLTCWIFLLLPQIFENHRNRSASAISLPFLLLWSAGDVCNLVGAVWAGVVVEMVVAVGVYWCVTDLVVVAQWLFYHYFCETRHRGDGKEGGRRRKRRSSSDVGVMEEANGQQQQQQQRQYEEEEIEGGVEADEQDPLLASQRNRDRNDSVTSIVPAASSEAIPKSKRRATNSFSSERTTSTSQSSPDDTKNQQQQQVRSHGHLRAWLTNTVSLLAVIAVGTAAWAIARHFGTWDGPTSPSEPRPGFDPNNDPPATSSPVGAQILGYLSALAYLSARIPQIIKNARSRSCQGLSLLFFLLSLLGNLTYGASILAHSLERPYLIANAPWLLGSLGTVGQDCVVFGQFWVYKRVDG